MSNLTADRKTAQYGTPDQEGPQYGFPLATGVTIYGGAPVVTDAKGNALAPVASTSPSYVSWGVAQRQAVWVSQAGIPSAAFIGPANTVLVAPGTFFFDNGTGGNEITNANRGLPCFWLDDHTVGISSIGSTVPVAGTIVNVDPVSGQVAVKIGDKTTLGV